MFLALEGDAWASARPWSVKQNAMDPPSRPYVERPGHYAAGRGWVGVAHAALPDRVGDDGAAQQDEGVRIAPRGIKRPNTTHHATHWAEGV